LQQADPDVICLQEINYSEQIPLLDFELRVTLINTGFQQQKGIAVWQFYQNQTQKILFWNWN
jgi:exonuclease III